MDVTRETETMIAEALGIHELTEELNAELDTTSQVADALATFENLPNEDKNAVLAAINFDVQPRQERDAYDEQMKTILQNQVKASFLTDLAA